MSDTCWSEARVALLKKLWLDGLSASQVARQLGGVSRNAVIGKVHRLGLAPRASPASRPARAAPRPTDAPPRARPARPARRPQTVAAGPSQPRPETSPGLATAHTLAAHMCKWPIGDPLQEGFSFCGRPAARAFCPVHARLAYKPGAPKPLDLDPVIRRLLAG